jgi:hypothetical protein
MAEQRPQSTAELISDIEREWSELRGVIRRLSPAQMSAPDAGGWSPKDNLAHLAEWMKVLMGYHMDRRPAHEVLGVPVEVTKDWDMDVISPVLFERNRIVPEAVTAELEQVYAELIANLRATPFSKATASRMTRTTPSWTWVLGDTTEHIAEHRATIEKAL